MNRFMRRMAVVLVLALSLASVARGQAKNVILMISDGQGFNTVEAATYYAGKPPVFAGFPAKYAVTTYSASGLKKLFPGAKAGYDPAKAWNPDYFCHPGSATDSASAATALNSGVKIADGVLNIAPDGDMLTPIARMADAQGKATGAVTTVQWSHATPAGVWVRNKHRDNYQEIAREMVFESGLDVIMGAGHPEYDGDGQPRAKREYKFVGGEETWNKLAANETGKGWTFTDDRAKIERMADGKDLPARLLATIRAAKTTNQERKGDGQTVNMARRNVSVPSLSTMSLAALNVLNQDADGFYLMIEGGAVDWAGHDNHKGRLIEEQLEFHDAVAAVVGWIEANGGWDQTLLIVTSDHETGYLWGPDSGPGTSGKGVVKPVRFDPIRDEGPGRIPGMSFHSGDHTNSLVPMCAKGAGADLFKQYAVGVDQKYGVFIDNTDIFKVMSAAINVGKVVAGPTTVPAEVR